jgi:hypothetical protein
VRACELDVAVRKPGNVSRVSPGHGMQWGIVQRQRSASAEPLFRTGARVGERIEAAVAATSAAVGCNTNLGILLLCAPVARCDRAAARDSRSRGVACRDRGGAGRSGSARCTCRLPRDRQRPPRRTGHRLIRGRTRHAPASTCAPRWHWPPSATASRASTATAMPSCSNSVCRR